jgi:uncharacterized membrane protein
MRTPASVAGHPIHPMLVPIAIGLWIFSFVCDLFFLSGRAGAWSTVALYTMVGGIVGALLAAIPGLIDLLSLPEGPKRTAIIHMTINLTVVALFAINAWMRFGNPNNLGTPIFLSAIALGLLIISGWLGGKMVYEHGVGVDTGALPGQAERR